jgi:Spy/CpxP family protein refolding chaperone
MSISLSVYGDDDHHFPMDLHDLGLTKPQHHSLEEVMKEYQSSNRRYHHQNKKSQEELNTLFVSSSFDSEAYRTKSLEMEKASIEIRARLLERLHSILTSEQRRRFTHHLEEWDSE